MQIDGRSPVRVPRIYDSVGTYGEDEVWRLASDSADRAMTGVSSGFPKSVIWLKSTTELKKIMRKEHESALRL